MAKIKKRGKGGRSRSRKSKDSKIKKLIRFAKSRIKKKKR